MNEIVKHEDMPLGEIARAAAASRYFQVDPAQAVVKILMGRELGIAPVASLTDIHVIKGKTVIGAGAIAAKIKASDKYDYRVRTASAEVCELEFFERGESIGVHRYTMEQAQRAGLTGKDNWRKFAEDMLFARAISTGVRRHCPDVFMLKVYVPGEIPDGEEEPMRVTATVTSSPAAPMTVDPAPLPVEAEPVAQEARAVLEAQPITEPEPRDNGPTPRRRRRRA